eukprot:71457-Hanusia_phi.AAC.6
MIPSPPVTGGTCGGCPATRLSCPAARLNPGECGGARNFGEGCDCVPVFLPTNSPESVGWGAGCSPVGGMIIPP